MGSFEGHLLPGLGFLAFACYYSVLASLALLQEQRVLKHLMLPEKLLGHRRFRKVSYEALAKVVIPTICIVGEYFYPIGVNHLQIIDWKDPRRPFVFKDSWQHVTMFGFFLLSGVVDIVSQSHLARWGVKLERAMEALSFYVLVLLMGTHIENKSSLEIRLHVFLMIPSFLVALALTVEVWAPNNPQIWLLKGWLGLVLSIWLFQICEVYVPFMGQPWQSEDPIDLAFLTIFFCWHLALATILLITIYGLCSLWYYHYSSRTKTHRARYQRCPVGSSGEELEKLKAETLPQDGVV